MRKRFKTTLVGDESGKMETAAISLPFDARDAWGKARMPVRVTINGHMWRSTVANMGDGQFIVVNATARAGAGVKAGDTVTVTLEPDTEKRDVEIPPALKRALGAALTAKLDALSFTHKKEYVLWFTEVKKDETRARRVEKMKKMLGE
jgi:ribosomal 50S subunit-recycling heat shock protein